MGGGPIATPPQAPAGAPTWVGSMLREIVDWVHAMRRGPQGLTGYPANNKPQAAAFARSLAWDATNGGPIAADDAGTWNNVAIYATGATTAVSNAGTINRRAGKLTTESLITAGGAGQTVTITNATVAATDLVMCSIANGTNTGGIPLVGLIVPGAGVFTADLRNTHVSSAFNGTLVLSFLVLKA